MAYSPALRRRLRIWNERLSARQDASLRRILAAESRDDDEAAAVAQLDHSVFTAARCAVANHLAIARSLDLVQPEARAV